MGIISKEKFFETACEIKHRKRITKSSDGIIETSGKKYNGQKICWQIYWFVKNAEIHSGNALNEEK